MGLLPIALGLAHGPPVRAEDGCKAIDPDCVVVGHWNFSVELGAGIRSNPLLHGESLPLVVIPQFSYYGRRLFLDDLDLGLTLAESDHHALNLVASPSYDRVFFYRSDLQNIFVTGSGAAAAPVGPGTPGAVHFPPPSRRVTYLAGPEYTFQFGGMTGQFDVLREITDQNHGYELRAALGIPLLPRPGSLAASGGFTWKSAAIVNYYYGDPGIYRPGAALNPFVKLRYTLPLAGKWCFDAFAEYERLGRPIGDSPIVTERHVTTAFIGALYPF